MTKSSMSKKPRGRKYFAKYYNDNKGMSHLMDEEIKELDVTQNKIKEINLVLLDFQFKKATRQPIKPHEIKIAKKERARLITQYWELYRSYSHRLTTT